MSIQENVNKVAKNIPKDVTLIAVSKTKSIEEIKEAYNAGIINFGENKVQELMSKIDSFSQDVKWHLIGHLQRNKVKNIVGRIELIHSLDSTELLNEIEKQYKSKNLIAEVLIQINIGKEPTKTGIDISELDQMLDACEKCSNVKVKGLMAVIPQGSEETCRFYFSEMKKVWDDLSKKDFMNIEMKYLSMGMSGDYEIAISEGSNMVRIGQGIFGKREYNNK